MRFTAGEKGSRPWAVLALAGALVWWGCGGSTPTAPADQPYNEHEWVETSRHVSGVRGVVLAMPGTLRIEQGGEEGITLRGEMWLLPIIVTQLRGGVLEIFIEGDWVPHPGRPTEIVLVAPALESAELAAHGSIECSGFAGERLELRASETGDLEFSGLDTEELEVTSTWGAGSIRVSGDVVRQNVELRGVADYEARDLRSAEARVVLSGSGSATVRVRDRLTAAVTGSGSIYYLGDPVVESTVTGSGEVVRLGD
jgi:hypothetical protein